MSNATQFKVGTVQATISGATSERTTNLSAPVSNTEVSLLLSDNLKKIIIRSRNLAKIQYAFVSGNSSTNFVTIPGGASLSVDGLSFTGKTLYIQTDSSSNTIEIQEFF